MGTNISRGQLADYRELVKDRISEDSIRILYSKFMRAAPEGYLSPPLFKLYIDQANVFKDGKIRQRQKTKSIFKRDTSAEEEENAEPDLRSDFYAHLFRGYDMDGDGIITFREYVLYHVAIMYNTEELFAIIFDTFDADGDGYLSLADLRTVITASTRYVGDLDVMDREVQRVIDEEARRLMGFLDIRRTGFVEREDMRLTTQKYPQILEKMKCLM